MTSSEDYEKHACVQSPAERGGWMKGLQPGFQLQPLGTSSSQGIRQRQEASSHGTNLTETELGSTLVGGKQPPLASHREARQKAHREHASALRLKQDSKAMWPAEEWPTGPFALVPLSSTPWEPIVKQEGSLPRIYTGEI